MAKDADYKLLGWVAEDSESALGKLSWKEYEPKAWEESDVDVKISHSGVCGSDIHTLRDDWGGTIFPCVVGHEIVGTVVRVGSQAGDFKIGETVGIGAQSDSCRSRDGPCKACETDEENYCRQRINTYDSIHRNGSIAQGGFGLYARAPAHFVIRIPPGVDPAHAAPMLCGGVTVYSPFKHHGVGPGSRVGIIGIGGLGHFAIMFAKAMGASKIVAISRRLDKKKDALALGADEYIASAEDEGWEAKHSRSLDVVLSTISSKVCSPVPMGGYLGLLDVGGTFVQLGLPEEGLHLMASSLTKTRARLAGSIIGSPSEIREMLQLAADKEIKPWVELRPMEEANQAILDMADGLPRYRYVLTTSGSS
ncbi:unnamed protein product [Clonostachys byssicola]|uniref:alcohol dehydrogenase (NADP(+)) n=1 Tax=Clonostachys byssicola TaxID=160290 RepID=A0A9N9TVM6_9HYPO|nr:unnamed protein product [Clonostachys byssicola]